jgi:DNA-binding MarR family transcriptional regulator
MLVSKLRLYDRLQRAARRLQRAADDALSVHGVSTAQSAALAVVASENGVSQRTLAATLGVKESAITPMAARLEALGWIARNRDGEDARAWRLRATPTGRAMLKRVQKSFGEINARLEAELAAFDVRTLASALDAIADDFDE